MKKVALISLGCAKNLVDSENILGLLLKNHYEIISNKEEADILIINTCGFIESSKKESIDVILDNINTFSFARFNKTTGIDDKNVRFVFI